MEVKLNHNDIFTIPNIKTANFYIDITIFYSMMQKKIVKSNSATHDLILFYSVKSYTSSHILNFVHVLSEDFVLLHFSEN